MTGRGGARALLLAAAALFCLCCLAAGPAAAQTVPKVAVAKPASAAVELEQAAAGQTAAAEQQALDQARLAGAADQEQQQAGGADPQAVDQGGSADQQAGGADQQAGGADQLAGGTDQLAGGQGGSTTQMTEGQAAAMLDPTQEQLQQEAAAAAAAAAESDTMQQEAVQQAEQLAASVPDPAAAGQGVVVLVVYKQPGADLTADQAIAKANSNNATLREFVRRLSGGLGAPGLPLDSISFLGAQAFDPSTMPGVEDTGCKSLAGAWVQANMRVNTPLAYAAFQNITTSLSSAAATATEARWNATVGQAAGGGKAPCFAHNFTNFRYTPASTPPPAPPSPKVPSPTMPTASAVASPPPPLPVEDSPSPAGPWFPTTGAADTSGSSDSSSSMDGSGDSNPYGPSDTSGSSDASGTSSTAGTGGGGGGSGGNPAYGNSPTPVYTSPSVEPMQSPGASPNLSGIDLDGTGAATGTGTGTGGIGGIGGSPSGIGGSPSVNSPSVNSPMVSSPVPMPGTASPPASPLPVPSYTPVLAPPTPYAPPTTYVPSTPYLNGGSGAALPPGEDPFGSLTPGSEAMAPSAAPAPLAQCTAEPTCKLFAANAACCKQRGSVAAGSSLRLWLVCNRDVYLPETKCLTVTSTASKVTFPAMDPLYADPLNTVNVTVLDRPNARAAEYSVGLPLAFFVPPISTSPGRLSVKLDVEEKRMEESDGTCSLRLREPCEWDGKMYAAVVPVDTLPVLSVMSEADTTSAYTQVQAALAEARKQAEQAAAAYGDNTGTTGDAQLGTGTGGSVSTSSLRSAGRSMLAAWGTGMGRRLDGMLPLGRHLQADKKNATDKATVQKKDTGKETGDDKKNGDAKKTGDDKKKTDTKDTDAKKTDKAEGKKNTGGKKKTDDKKNTGGKKDTTKKDQDKVTAKEVPSSSSGLNVAPGGQAVGSDLPAPSVDAAALPPLTDALAANYTSDVNVEDFSVSWLPLQSGAGKPACQSASTADLPESFLLGDFQELKGAEQMCSFSQLGADLPSAAALAASAGQAAATSSACRRFSLF